MKKLILTIAALAAVAFTASAQMPVYYNQTIGVPATLTGATNLATPLVLDFRYQDIAAVFGTIASASIQTNLVTAYRSIDGTVAGADTNNVVNIALQTVTTGAKKNFGTNITMNGYGYLVITRIAPTDTTIANTNTLTYPLKFR